MRPSLSRGEWLIRQADQANPYRVRADDEAASSRSPQHMSQAPGIPDPYEGLVPVQSGTFGPGSQPNRLMFQSINPPAPAELARFQNGHYEQPGNLGQILNSAGPGNEMRDQNYDGEQSAGELGRLNDAAGDKHKACEKDDQIECEFAAPCRMDASPDGLHFRKVVSHVFGRNKAVTKIFPQEVWVHYCRKHYQRARYRADQWPFTQCDLLLESLRRMEEWNGVIDFELTLRRRERIRVADESNDKSTQKDSNRKLGGKSTTKNTRPGRKHPTAIIAPAPDWLRDCTGEHLSFEQIRVIIERIREYMTSLRRQEREIQAERDDAEKKPLLSKHGNWKPELPIRTQSKRHNNKPHPYKIRQPPSMVRFPDIEILPNFKDWVREAALRQRSATAPRLTTHSDKDKDSIKMEAAQNGGPVQPRRPQSTIPYRPRTTQNNGQSFAPTPASTTQRGFQGTIGRAGTNRGSSASQQRRSERVFQLALDRITRGSRKRSDKSGKKPDTKPDC